jgi:hypothetical protein
MWGRLGPRFAVEAGFLVLLAVGLGLADQGWAVIVAVMAAGWALVSLIELVASQRTATTWTARPAPTAEEPLPAEPEPSPEPESPLRPEPAPAASSAEPGSEVAGGGAEPAPAPVGDAPGDTQELAPPDVESRRRRWFRRRKPVEETDDGIPEPPSHVRRLDRASEEEPAAAESAEGHS